MNKSIIILFFVGILMASCGSDDSAAKKSTPADKTPEPQEMEKASSEPAKEELTGDLANKGIGPITHVELDDEIDQMMVNEGKEIFKLKCSACHKISKKKIGPPMKGITKKRSPEWIMNMILNPEEMTAKDPIAKKLLEEYSAPMANQSLEEDEARALLEYFRTKN